MFWLTALDTLKHSGCMCDRANQDATEFEFVWSCVGMRPVGGSLARKCTDAAGLPLKKLDLYRSSTVALKPEHLNLRTKTVYEFQVTVRAGAGKSTDQRSRFVSHAALMLLGRVPSHLCCCFFAM